MILAWSLSLFLGEDLVAGNKSLEDTTVAGFSLTLPRTESQG